MEFEIIDNYTSEAIVKLFGVGVYGKNVLKYIHRKEISGLDCKESISDPDDSDLIFLIVSQDELSNVIEDYYNLAEGSTLSYLYVMLENNIDFCNSMQLNELQNHFDVIIPIVNKADDVESIYWSIRGITELITTVGMICVDFADVRITTKNMGIGITSHGLANTGTDKYVAAAKQAIESLLISEIDLKNVKAFIVSIIANITDVEIDDYYKIGEMVKNLVSEDADVLVGLPITPNEDYEICVSITANGVCEI